MTDSAPPAMASVPRALVAAVIGMGVAIVVGVAVLAGTMVHRMAVSHTAGVLQTSPPAVRDFVLPVLSGTHIVSVAARGDGTLAIVLDERSDTRLVIWNPDAGRIVGTFSLQPAP